MRPARLFFASLFAGFAALAGWAADGLAPVVTPAPVSKKNTARPARDTDSAADKDSGCPVLFTDVAVQ